jgi:hypothetical protein
MRAKLLARCGLIGGRDQSTTKKRAVKEQNQKGTSGPIVLG